MNTYLYIVKRAIILLLFFFGSGMANDSRAQSSNYQSVDQYVLSLGPMPGLNLAVITDSLTLPFTSKAEKARALFIWMANYIEIDPKTTSNYDNRTNDASGVFLRRKGNPTGISLLFQEMCSLASIRCISVEGYYKYHTDEIGDPSDEPNYAWNVVQLSTSPTEWYYIDVSSASGFLDRRKSTFTRQVNDVYFFADRVVFNLQHYPANKAWQLGEGPASVKSFYNLPCVLPGAYAYKLSSALTPSGLFVTSTEKKSTFKLLARRQDQINNIELIIGEGAKAGKPIRVNFTIENNTIEFQHTFAKSDTYPATVLFDGLEVLRFVAEVE